MEEERKQKREEKLERLRHQPRHIFVDPKYDQQKKEVVDNLDDAISQGKSKRGNRSIKPFTFDI